jgi:ferredoxin
MAYTDVLARHGERVTLLPGDETGPMDLAALLGSPRPDTLVYCCGPERLLAGVEEVCSATWPAGALHLERFAAKEIEAPAGGERSFELVLAGSGVTVQVPPDRSVFNVIEDAGISVLGSCHEGICGTCEQIVLEGEVDHRDSVLNESEQAANDAMMVCVSRCFSDRLVLDL